MKKRLDVAKKALVIAALAMGADAASGTDGIVTASVAETKSEVTVDLRHEDGTVSRASLLLSEDGILDEEVSGVGTVQVIEEGKLKLSVAIRGLDKTLEVRTNREALLDFEQLGRLEIDASQVTLGGGDMEVRTLRFLREGCVARTADNTTLRINALMEGDKKGKIIIRGGSSIVF